MKQHRACSATGKFPAQRGAYVALAGEGSRATSSGNAWLSIDVPEEIN